MNYIIVKNDKAQVKAGAITENNVESYWSTVFFLVTSYMGLVQENNLITVTWPGCSTSQAKALCKILTSKHESKADAVEAMEEWYLNNLIIPVQP